MPSVVKFWAGKGGLTCLQSGKEVYVENAQLDRMSLFLRRFKSLLDDQSDQRLQRIQSVLQGFRPLLDDLKKRRQRMAPRFNVFEVLDVGNDEKRHSRFIKYLLDPTAWHDQGDTFLLSFLQILKSLKPTALDFSPSSVQGAKVDRELPLRSYGIVDIYIRLADGQIVLIENKLSAPEGDRQLERYQSWLDLQPQGAFPPPACFSDTYGAFSFNGFTARGNHPFILFTGCGLAIQTSLDHDGRSAYGSFATVCGALPQGYGGMVMTDDAWEFLRKPENLEAALGS